ncbi:MAG: hypothetical protein AABZ30_14830 [Myxococcota bacterium]
MAEPTWMLYGANGYTGALIAEEAVRTGARPILAGRRAEAVRPIAERLGLPWRAFALDDGARVQGGLDGVSAILLAAGPFSKTSAPVVEACLAKRVHYLDITGEWPVFEACHRRSQLARDQGVVLMPGVGFDIVPSDCLAARLAQALPGATKLELAFAAIGTASPGTTKTMLEGLPHGGAIRQDGRIRRVPLAWRAMDVPFRDRARHAVTIPWGDISTAFYSTKIPNIETYMALPRRLVLALRAARPLLPLLGIGAVQRRLMARIERTVKGPDQAMRDTLRSQLWGRATDAAGRAVCATLEAPEGYRLTAMTSVECARRIAAGEVEPGARTPSMAFGVEFITRFESDFA